MADWLRADASFDENEPSTRKGKLRAADLCEQLAALLRARDEAKPVAWANAKELEALQRDAKKHGSVVYEIDVCGREGMHNTVPLYTSPPTDSAEAKWKDPTGFSSQSIRDEANNWTQRHTGKEMLLNYAACLEAMCAESREGEVQHKSTDCPHASPFRYCPECIVDPCPVGLGRKK